MKKQKHNSLKQALIVFALMVVGLTLVSFVPSALAQGLIKSTDNPNNISQATGGATSAKQLVLTIVNYFLYFLGLIATLMVIYGGILYVTAAGDTEKVDKGKKVISYALIGIIIILLSFALVNSVLGAGLGNESTT